MAVDSAVFMTN